MDMCGRVALVSSPAKGVIVFQIGIYRFHPALPFLKVLFCPLAFKVVCCFARQILVAARLMVHACVWRISLEIATGVSVGTVAYPSGSIPALLQVVFLPRGQI